MTTKAEISLCGAVDLLAAIFGEDCNQLRSRYGLPFAYPACSNCGKKLNFITITGYCRECWNRLRHIKVVCSECGEIFDITQSVLIERVKSHKVDKLFCSKHCWGKHVGKNYGFIAHPKNVRRGQLRKWDWNKVYELRDRTGWGSHRISRALGMPLGTVDVILYGRRKDG